MSKGWQGAFCSECSVALKGVDIFLHSKKCDGSLMMDYVGNGYKITGVFCPTVIEAKE